MELNTTGSQKILQLEAQLKTATDQQTRIDLLHEIAWVVHLSDPVKGLRYAEQAYELSSRGDLPYLTGLAGSLRSLIAFNTDTGDYSQALSQSLQALEILEKIPDEKIETRRIKIDVLGVVSWTYRCLGDYAVSAEYAMKGLKIAKTIGERQYESGPLNILSVIYAESNDLSAALEVGQKFVQYCHEDGNIRGESIGLNNMAMTYLELGNGEQALATCQQSLRLAQENGIEGVIITALSTLGEIYLGIENLVSAEEYLLQALKMAHDKKARPDELQCLINLGKVYQYQQNNQDALSTLQKGLSLSQTANDRRSQFQCHQLLSEVYERQGDLVKALHHFKQYHLVKEEVFNETADHKLKNLRISHEVETLKKESEIHRLKNVELQAALEQVKQLSGLLPICANCKKIRDDTGYWQDVAVYIRDHSEAEFSHGICPDCMEELYPEIAQKRRNKDAN
ncbi:MAG: tetratricopeptide repeat protein [Ardenticatenaceae bacterium]|nr:tetratricopeptide repeat protein [Ardenticatenaceae bacterium]MCB9443507.1 tetratricopeptide repeat protein [Ardenticatenaceae bacterium]